MARGNAAALKPRARRKAPQLEVREKSTEVPPPVLCNSYASAAAKRWRPRVGSGRSNLLRNPGLFGSGPPSTLGQSVTGRGVVRDSTGARSAATASRWVRALPNAQRSRSVRITEVLRNSWFTTVPRSIQAEIANVGMRTPERSNRKPICPAGAARSGGGTLGGGTWS